jgi:acyl dehydratase
MIAYRRVLLQGDFDRFAKLSGDDNPIHCDPEFAAKSHFGATVAHGMLLYACICKALTEQVGPGVVQLEQTLMFPNPTFAGDMLDVDLQVGVESRGVLDVATGISKVGAGGTAIPTVIGRCRVAAPDATISAVAPASKPTEQGDAELYGLHCGMSAVGTRAFSVADLDEYGDLSGDRNPIFRDDAAAKARGFGRRIVPWPLLAGMFSDLLGTRLPGRGTGWMKQELHYSAVAYPDEALTATVTIVRLRADKELVNLATRIHAADGRLVCDGEALVHVRNLENRSGPRSA